MAVREEVVRLSLEDAGFSTGTAKATAEVALLNREIKSLDGSGMAGSRGIDRTATAATRARRPLADAAVESSRLSKELDDTAAHAKKAESALDSFSGRAGLLASTIAALGPSLGPILATSSAGLAGLANDAGMAAIAGGSLAVAMHGVGDAIQAVNKYALDPTTANLHAARLAMDQLSPAAQEFVRQFQQVMPLLHQIQGSAAAGWFPGLTRALHELEPLAPVIEKIFQDVGTAGGNLIAEGASSLAGSQWRDFFEFVDTEAPKALTALGRVVGSLTHGLAELWMAFSPLNTSFNEWLVFSARSFDEWASGLSQTQGFEDFVSYIRENGPRVAAALEAIGNAALQLVQAAAPLGGPTLNAITALANAIATIADSPLGTPILLMLQLASVARLASAAVGGLGSAFKLMGAQALVAGEEATAAAAAGGRGRGPGFLASGRLGAYGLAAYGLSQIGQPIVHSLTGNPTSTGTDPKGLSMVAGDLATVNNWVNNNALAEGLQNVTHLFGLLGSTPMQASAEGIDKVDKSLADMVAAGNGTQAAAEMDKVIAAGEKQGVTADQTRAAMDDYAAAVANAGGADAIAAQQVEKHRAALVANRQALAEAFDAETNWRAALKAASKQADSNSAGIKGNSDAALANRAALAQLRDAWNNQSAAVQNDLVKQAQARDAFIKTATAMGVPIKQAQQLAKQLLGIPTHINPIIKILANTQGLDDTLHKMQLLHDKTVNVWVKTYTVHQPSPSNNANGANGFHIDPTTGQAVPGRAAGGTIPHDGGPYRDRYLTLLAPGEEVISNRFGQADRHRDLLKAINANLLPSRIQADYALASGGTVGSWMESAA